MALVQRPHLARLRFRDDDLAESTCEAQLGSGVDPASAAAWLASWRTLVAAVSSAVCTDADLLIRYVETTPATPGVDSDCQREAVLIFDAGVPALAVVRVPSIAESMLLASGPYAGIAIDQANADVAALLGALSAGLGGTQPIDPFGVDLGDLVQAYMQRS
jgi:hypothetical protein